MGITYHYIPEPGERIRLRGDNRMAIAVSCDGTSVHGIFREHTWNEETKVDVTIETPFEVYIGELEPPTYFKQVYDVYLEPDKVEEFKSWFTRGIVVRGCLDLGSAGRVIYQPLDNCAAPHWAYTQIHDRVIPQHCKDRFRLHTREFMYDAHVKRPCKYCHGTGMRTDAAWIHFTWVEGHQFFGQESVPCWVCGGTGRKNTYINEMVGKEQKEAKAELEKLGWKLSYRRRHDRGWEAERIKKIKESV